MDLRCSLTCLGLIPCKSLAGKNHLSPKSNVPDSDNAIVSIKVHQELCAPKESCEEGTRDTEPTNEELIKTDSTEVDEKEMVAVEEPPLEWLLGVSEDLKVSERRWGQL